MLLVSVSIGAQPVLPLHAQFRMASLAPCYVAEWHHAEVIIENRSERSLLVAPRALITKNGRLLMRTKLPHRRCWTIAPGQQLRLAGPEIFGTLISSDGIIGAAAPWQATPDTGQLSVCIHLTDSLGTEILAEPLCQTVTLYNYSLPIPLAPVTSDTLPTARMRTVRFVWMPVLPQRKGTCYQVRCFALPDSLGVAEAVRVQQPLLDQRCCDCTELRWHIERLQPGRYVWSVQAFDRDNLLPIGSTDGYSLTATFTVVARVHGGPLHRRNHRVQRQ
ncbi:MAG: hypothetical protein N2663_00065 [Chlorobi bacterium]|nr:hypothetical protein [Chlorobiota bacterium]